MEGIKRLEEIRRYSVRIEKAFQLKDIIKKYGGCQQCGWCCRNERLTIFTPDVEKLGSVLKPEYIYSKEDISVTLILPCPFINSKNRCNIYNRRSGICQTYPFLLHYPGQLTIGYNCPLGKKICEDIIKYCEHSSIKIVGDESKTEEMKYVDNLTKDMKLNSGEGYESKIVNVPFEIFMNWRKTKARK